MCGFLCGTRRGRGHAQHGSPPKTAQANTTLRNWIVRPNAIHHGRDALDAEIARFHSEMPGVRAVLTSGVDSHHDVLRFAVALLDGGGRRTAEAVDIGDVGQDGLLCRIITFWGPPAPVPDTWPQRWMR